MEGERENFVHLRRFIPRVVDRLKEYKVAYRGLGEGSHLFEFDVDSGFFDCFDATRGTNGAMKVRVELVKSAALMEMRVRIEGTVRAVCDRCLGEMDLPVSGEMNLYVKVGNPEEGNGDDYIVVSADTDYLDLSEPVYELYMLSYPMRVVHAEGECDGEMEAMLDAYAGEEPDEVQAMDPRWEALKKLKFNN